MTRVPLGKGQWDPANRRGRVLCGPLAALLCFSAIACRRDASGHLDRGDRLLALGEHKQAIVEYQSALNVEPSAHAERGLGLAYAALSAFAEAQRHLKAAIEAKPNDSDARVALARVSARFGQFDQAREHLLSALDNAGEEDPNRDTALLLFGVYAETRAQIQQALELLEARLERQRQLGRSTGLESQLVLADLLARLNRVEAAEQLRQGARYLPLDNPRQTLQVAQASQERDNYELSRALVSPLVERQPTDLDAWQLLAAAAIELGRYDEVRDAMGHLGPRRRDPEVQLLHARLALSSGMEAESTATLRALLEQLPRDQQRVRARVRRTLADALMAHGEYDEAVSQLNAVLSEDAQDVEASLSLARLHLRRGEPERAVAVLSALPEHHGRLAQAYMMLGEAQLDARRLDLAEQSFRRGWELAPQEPAPRYWLAVTLRRRGQTEQARRLLEGNLKRFPTHAESLSELLELLEESAGVQAARTFLVGHVRQHGQSPEVSTLEGQWLLAHRDTEHALSAYRRALTANAGFYPAAAALSRFYVRHERGNLAQSVIDAALAQSPKAVPLLLLGARTAAELRQYDQARRYCQRALQASPGHPLALAQLAVIEAEGFRDLPRAKELATQAYAMAPSRAEVLDAFGWVTHLSGDPTRALVHLESAARAQPDEAQILYHWGAALLAAGRPAAANEKLARVLRLDPWFPTAPEIRGLLARR